MAQEVEFDALKKGYATPESIADLVGYLGACFTPSCVLDPACGMGRFISFLMKYAPKKPGRIRGIDINSECTKYTSSTFKENSNIVIKTGDSLSKSTFKKGELYDLIMCEPPFGGKHTIGETKISTEIAFLERCLTLLQLEGHLLIVVPDGVLFRSDKRSRNLRSKILKEFNLISLFSIPLRASVYSSVKLSILCVQNTKPTKKPIVFGDFKDTDFNKEAIWTCISQYCEPDPPLFLIERNKVKDEMQLGQHLPTEYKLGVEKLVYPVVKMTQIAEIKPLKSKKELTVGSLILRRVGNFKIVSSSHLDLVSDKTIKNYSLLEPKPNVDLDFLKMTLESDIFKKQADTIARGTYIRSISHKDVANILIPLPTLEEQTKIADNYRKIEEVLSNTQILKEKILKNPFSKDVFLDKKLLRGLDNFSDQVIKKTLHDLPSPIAIVLRQTKSTVSGKDTLSNSVALFETLVKFMVVLIIMEVHQENILDDIPEKIGVSFIQPSTGTWFKAFKNITKEILDIDSNEKLLSSLICQQIVTKSKDIIKVVDDSKAISIRNDFLGHGAVGIPDDTFKIKSDEMQNVSEYLLNEIIELLRGYELIYVKSYRKSGGTRCATIKNLMGENRDFLTEEIEIPIELDTDKVLLVSQDYSAYVSLEPLLHLGVCSVCGSENLFFFDKRHKNKVEYFSHLHSHKTSFGLLEDIKRILPLSK